MTKGNRRADQSWDVTESFRAPQPKADPGNAPFPRAWYKPLLRAHHASCRVLIPASSGTSRQRARAAPRGTRGRRRAAAWWRSARRARAAPPAPRARSRPRRSTAHHRRIARHPRIRRASSESRCHVTMCGLISSYADPPTPIGLGHGRWPKRHNIDSPATVPSLLHAPLVPHSVPQNAAAERAAYHALSTRRSAPHATRPLDRKQTRRNGMRPADHGSVTS